MGKHAMIHTLTKELKGLRMDWNDQLQHKSTQKNSVKLFAMQSWTDKPL